MTSRKTANSTAIAAPPKPPTPKPPTPSDDHNAALAAAVEQMPTTKSSEPTEALKDALEQAEAAAEDQPKVRPPSKTHGILPTHSYPGPAEGRSWAGDRMKAIPTRDTLPRRYLVLIARPEGCDENTGRRVNTNCGPTRGGFARYTADSTGIPVIYSKGAYRVGVLDSGKVRVADEAIRDEVYQLCGGDKFAELVIDQLGPDFTIGLPPKAAKTVKSAKATATPTKATVSTPSSGHKELSAADF